MENEVLQCTCDDGCLSPVIAVKTNNKWQLYGISKVFGMGFAEWEKKLFEVDYDQVIPLNSFSGLSYILVCKNNKYGLIQIKANNKAECEVTMIENMTYDNIDKLLQDKNINPQEYFE